MNTYPQKMHKMWILYVNLNKLFIKILKFNILILNFFHPQNLEKKFFKKNCTKIVLFKNTKKPFILLDF